MCQVQENSKYGMPLFAKNSIMCIFAPNDQFDDIDLEHAKCIISGSSLEIVLMQNMLHFVVLWIHKGFNYQ